MIFLFIKCQHIRRANQVYELLNRVLRGTYYINKNIKMNIDQLGFGSDKVVF